MKLSSCFCHVDILFIFAALGISHDEIYNLHFQAGLSGEISFSSLTSTIIRSIFMYKGFSASFIIKMIQNSAWQNTYETFHIFWPAFTHPVAFSEALFRSLKNSEKCQERNTRGSVVLRKPGIALPWWVTSWTRTYFWHITQDKLQHGCGEIDFTHDCRCLDWLLFAEV